MFCGAVSVARPGTWKNLFCLPSVKTLGYFQAFRRPELKRIILYLADALLVKGRDVT
jgi:hypothetical protein